MCEEKDDDMLAVRLNMRNAGIRKIVTKHNLKLQPESINSYMLICFDTAFLCDSW